MIYRPLFLADVEECADYLTEKAGDEVADAWRDVLKLAIQHVHQMPEIARLRHDLPMPGIRALNLRKYPNYLVFYRLEKDAIELLRVRHGMMHLPALFSET